jgi:hypothetical protein
MVDLSCLPHSPLDGAISYIFKGNCETAMQIKRNETHFVTRFTEQPVLSAGRTF